MEKYIWQKTEYLEGLRKRLIQENAVYWEWKVVVDKINYILECREQWKEPKLCQDTCDGSCKINCINRK